MEKYIGKVVANYPHVIKAGNTWISDVVYKIDKNYWVTKVVQETIGAGPRDIGEEVEVIHRSDNALADDWMVETYKNPKAYKASMLKRKNQNDRKLKEAKENAEEKGKGNTFLNLIIILLILAILIVLAWIIFFGN